MVTVADTMILEARLKGLAPRMRIGLLILRGQHNSPHPNPVRFTFGSNSFLVDMQDLEPFMDLLDTDEPTTANCFLLDYLQPFLKQHAV